MNDRIRRRAVISGRVQGVWFRDSTRQVARQLGLAGWVRNCSDGTVEAVFEGRAEPVEQAILWCRSGPPRAYVANVAVSEEEPTGARGFEIR